MDVVLYHNPSCSKSRQTMTLLNAKGIQPKIVHYLDTPPDADELATILDMLGFEPRELMRKSDKAYTDAQLDNPDLTREQLIDAMVQNPSVIQRPIVVFANKAAVGRPPESVLKLFD